MQNNESYNALAKKVNLLSKPKPKNEQSSFLKKPKGFFDEHSTSVQESYSEHDEVTSLCEDFGKRYPMYSYTSTQTKPPAYNYPFEKERVNLSVKKMAQIPIPEPQKSLLSATCMGDSTLKIQKRYANARIQNRHSTEQADWFFWKWSICQEYTNGLSSITYQKPDGFQRKKQNTKYDGKLKITTKAHPHLTHLHSIICTGPKNQKTFKRSWLNHMTDVFLMVLWLDDGCLYNNYQGCFSLESFPASDLKIFVCYLRKVWGIESEFRSTGAKKKDGTPCYKVYLKNQQNLLKLLRIIAPLIPVKQMLYKVLFVPFNDTDLLQRWASELADKVQPEFRDYIIDFYGVSRFP